MNNFYVVMVDYEDKLLNQRIEKGTVFINIEKERARKLELAGIICASKEIGSENLCIDYQCYQSILMEINESTEGEMPEETNESTEGEMPEETDESTEDEMPEELNNNKKKSDNQKNPRNPKKRV